MYKTFDLFVEERDNQQFAEQFHALCEGIALSGLPFQEFWDRCAFPVLFESKFQDEQELFNEFNWSKSKLNPGNWGASNSGRSWSGERDPQSDMIGRMDQHYKGIRDKEEAEKESRQQGHLAQHQQTVDQSVASIKKEFVTQMREFLGAMQTKAQEGNDYFGYQIAKSFHDRMMKAAQPVIDSFVMKAKYGKRDDGDFAKGRDDMEKHRRTQAMDQLRQKQGQQQQQPNISPQQSGSPRGLPYYQGGVKKAGMSYR